MPSIAFFALAHFAQSVTLSLPLYDLDEGERHEEDEPFNNALCNRLLLDAASFLPSVSYLEIHLMVLSAEEDGFRDIYRHEDSGFRGIFRYEIGSEEVYQRLHLDWQSIAGIIAQRHSIRSINITLLSAFESFLDPIWTRDMLRIVIPHFKSFNVHYCKYRFQ